MDFLHGSACLHMRFVLLAGTIMVAAGLTLHDMDFRRGISKIHVHIWHLSSWLVWTILVAMRFFYINQTMTWIFVMALQVYIWDFSSYWLAPLWSQWDWLYTTWIFVVTFPKYRFQMRLTFYYGLYTTWFIRCGFAETDRFICRLPS
jgi:hypothetical protein